MKKTVKCLLSLFLVTTILLGTNEVVLSSVFGETSSEVVEYINFDLYKANILSGIKNVSEIESDWSASSILDYYVSEDAYSPSKSFLESLYKDKWLMAEIAAWNIYSASGNLSSALNTVLSLDDYCEILVLKMVNMSLNETCFTELMKGKAVKDAKNLTKSFYEVSEDIVGGIGSDLIKDLNIDSDRNIIENCLVNTINQSTIDASKKTELCSVLNDILDYSADISEAIDKISMYNQLSNITDETKDWLEQMIAVCPDNYLNIKSALKSVYLASKDTKGVILSCVQTTNETLVNWGIKKSIDALVDFVSKFNPVVHAVLSGLSAGTSICNLFFGTDDVCEQFYVMEQLVALEDLARQCLNNAENYFISNQTVDNAKYYNETVNRYTYTITYADIDCMLEFYKKLYNGGWLSSTMAWCFGASGDYENCVAALDNLKQVRESNFKKMNDYVLACFKIQHPEQYEYMFGSSGDENEEIPIESISVILDSSTDVNDLKMVKGSFKSLEVSLIPSNTTQTNYKITSDNDDVLSIFDNSIMVANSEGTANVTVTSVDNPEIFSSILITVTDDEESGENDNNDNEPPDDENGYIFDGDEDGDGFSDVDNFDYSVSDDSSVTIISLEDDMINSLVIPESIDGYPVTKIENTAFYKALHLVNVVLPDSITEIGDYAFWGCSNLSEVVLSENLKSIGKAAFFNCTSLSTIEFKSIINEIGDLAFYNCDQIESFRLSLVDNYLGRGAFGNCNSLRIISSPYIYAAGKFPYCTNITIDYAYIFGTNSIDNCGYYGWNELSTVTIPNNVKTIGTMAFEYTRLNHIFFTGSSTEWARINLFRDNVSLRKATKHFDADLENNVRIAESVVPKCLTEGYDIIECNYCNEEISKNHIPAVGHVLRKIRVIEPKCLEDGYTIYCCLECGEIIKNDLVESVGHEYINGYCITCNCPEGCEYRIEDSAVYIYKYIPCESNINNLIIPDYIDNRIVLGIDQYTFYKSSSLKGLLIPNSVIEFDWRTLSNCTELKRLIIGDGISNEIPDNQFKDFTALETISIGTGVNGIGMRAFSGCESLKQIIIPSNVKKVGSEAFKNCVNLDNVVIEDGVEGLSDGAFMNCSTLKTLTLPASVKTGHSTFFNTDISFVTVTKGTGIIPDYICNDYYIARSPWQQSKQCKVVLCEGITRIGEGTFYNSTGIYDITIPDTIVSIGGFAFDGCTNLTNIYIPKGLTCLEENVFANCTKLSEVTIPDGVTSIKTSAFEHCTSLTSIIIPKSVISIGVQAFGDCTGLTSITIPDNVTEFSWYSIDNCINLTSIIIGDGVSANVPNYFLKRITNLKSIVLGNGIKEIENGAFQDCINLFEITIGNNVKEIYKYTFENCTNLAKINIGNGVDYICRGAFNDTEYYKNSLNWIDGVLYVGDYLIEANNDLSGTYYIKEGTITIAESAFENCSKLSKVIVPDSLKNICNDAFECSHSYGPKNLTSVTFGENSSLEYIGDQAFQGCSKLTELSIPDTVKYIGENSFYSCLGLTSFVLSDGILKIGERAFGNNRNLKYIHLPSNDVIIEEDILCYTSAFICSDSEDCYAKSYADENGLEFRLCYGDHSSIDDFSNIPSIPSDAGVISQPTQKIISYGDSIILHVEASMIPSGGRAEWTASNDNFSWTVDGTTCIISPEKSGETTFTATIYDAQGKAVSKDTQTMTSKAGFFDKIIAFFKKLFGLTKTIPQVFKGII